MSGASRALRAPRVTVRPLPRWLVPLSSVVGLLALFELLSRTGVIRPDQLPAPTTVFQALIDEFEAGTASARAWETLQGWALGFGIATLVGIPAGILIGSSRLAYRLVRLIIEFLRPIPPVAVLPLAVLLWGTGIEMKAYLVAIAAFFPILYQALYGVQDVDPVARDTVRAYGLSRAAQFRHVVIPSAAPYIATGLRLSASIALIVAVAQEIIVGSTGIGYAINQVRNANDIPGMYAYILLAGLMGLVITVIFRSIEARALHWHASQRQEAVS